jgi:hypothetical protein
MILHSNALFYLVARQAPRGNAEQKPALASVPKQKRSFSVLRFILSGILNKL